MKKLILPLALFSSTLMAQTAKDVVIQLQNLDVTTDPVCETCEKTEQLYTPQEALKDIHSGKLEFMGRDLFPGSDQNRSCVYKSEKAYIIYNNCMANKKESPATDIEVISFNGGVTRFYVENNGGPPISTVPREKYDSTWTVSFMPSKAPGNLNIQQLKKYRGSFDAASAGGCFVGNSFGAQKMDSKGMCYGQMGGKGSSWIPSGESFWKDPGEEWMKTKRYLRDVVVKTKF